MTAVRPRRTLDVRVDGETVTVDEEATVLEACDAAGHYVPRLCHYPGLACCTVDPAGGPDEWIGRMRAVRGTCR